MEILALIQYKPEAGLFDPDFTSTDISFIVVIFLAWNIRMYMERKNKTIPSPTVEDYIFSFVIAYVITGALYQLCISKGWAVGVVMFPMALSSILSLSFIRWLFSTDGKNATNQGFKKLFNAFINFLSGMLDKAKTDSNEQS